MCLRCCAQVDLDKIFLTVCLTGCRQLHNLSLWTHLHGVKYLNIIYASYRICFSFKGVMLEINLVTKDINVIVKAKQQAHMGTSIQAENHSGSPP